MTDAYREPGRTEPAYPRAACQLRGRVQARYFMLSGVLGLGVAPTAIALVTDFVFHDDQAIRFALLVVLTPVACIGVIVCLLSQPAYRLLRREFLATTQAPGEAAR